MAQLNHCKGFQSIDIMMLSARMQSCILVGQIHKQFELLISALSTLLHTLARPLERTACWSLMIKIKIKLSNVCGERICRKTQIHHLRHVRSKTLGNTCRFTVDIGPKGLVYCTRDWNSHAVLVYNTHMRGASILRHTAICMQNSSIYIGCLSCIIKQRYPAVQI